jgi:hypothetical protein
MPEANFSCLPTSLLSFLFLFHSSHYVTPKDIIIPSRCSSHAMHTSSRASLLLYRLKGTALLWKIQHRTFVIPRITSQVLGQDSTRIVIILIHFPSLISTVGIPRINTSGQSLAPQPKSLKPPFSSKSSVSINGLPCIGKAQNNGFSPSLASPIAFSSSMVATLGQNKFSDVVLEGQSVWASFLRSSSFS